MLRSSRFAVVIALVSLGPACQGGEPRESPPEVSDTTDLASGSSSEAEEIPSRATEIARDEGSRPEEVMDLAGVGPGARVADIFAGGGYYTWLLSHRVGPEGRVYAQGYSPGLAARVARGDLADAGNVELVDSLSQLPEGQLDAAFLVRGYHLFEDDAALMDALRRSLKPSGRVVVVELRLGRDRGHDMETHRMGEATVIEGFERGGFVLAESSDILRNPEDDHTDFWRGRRHLADRMLLIFRPAEGGVAAGAGG